MASSGTALDYCFVLWNLTYMTRRLDPSEAAISFRSSNTRWWLTISVTLAPSVMKQSESLVASVHFPSRKFGEQKVVPTDRNTTNEYSSCFCISEWLMWEVKGQNGRSGSTVSRTWPPFCSLLLFLPTTWDWEKTRQWWVHPRGGKWYSRMFANKKMWNHNPVLV